MLSGKPLIHRWPAWADPTADIRNTEAIGLVIKSGRPVPRDDQPPRVP
jgi:hypothetical protein